MGGERKGEMRGEGKEKWEGRGGKGWDGRKIGLITTFTLVLSTFKIHSSLTSKGDIH